MTAYSAENSGGALNSVPTWILDAESIWIANVGDASQQPSNLEVVMGQEMVKITLEMCPKENSVQVTMRIKKTILCR